MPNEGCNTQTCMLKYKQSASKEKKMLWVLVLVLLMTPILEGVIWLIVDAIETRVTWKPFEKQYEQAIENSTPDNFVVLVNRDEKSLILLGIVCCAIVAVLGVVGSLVSYFVQSNQRNALIIGLVFEIITLPPMTVLIHYYSRRIFITQDALLIKSAIVKRKIDIGDIKSVDEIKVEFHKQIRIFCKHTKIELKDTVLNYDYLRNYFANKGLLEEDTDEIK